MSDLRLISILPPQPIQAVQQQPPIAGGQSQQTGISSYQIGSILSGFIINRDSGGNPILRTDSGDITFASNFFLKIGSEITIRIEHIAGNNSAHILSVNGQPPEVAVLQSGFLQEPEVIVSENLRSANQPANYQQTASNSVAISPPPSSPLSSITVAGTIISPAPPQPNSPNISPNNDVPQVPQALPNGSQLSLKIVSLTTPTATVVTSATTAPTLTETISTNIPTANIAKPENTPLTNTAINSPLNTSPNSPSPASSNHYAAYARTSSTTPTVIIPPQITASQPTPSAPNIQNSIITTTPTTTPQAGQQIIATVISNNKNDESIVQSPIGNIRLQTGVKLPIGSSVTFEIEQIKTTETSGNTANIVSPTSIASSPAPLTQLARNSGALSNIFTLLSGLNSSDSLNFINKNIPTITTSATNPNVQNEQSPHNILAPLLNLTSALRDSDFRTWIGHNNAKWLEDNGHENLLKKAEGEFLNIARQFVDSPEKQWQSLFFPIAIEGELQQARLFVKRDRKEKEKDGKRVNEEDTRFVLEMDLSQLGEMQMDGFVRRNNQNIQFDLVIRSHSQLSQEIQKDILQIYNNTGELTGYQGNIIFQTMKDFPVNPMEDIVTNKPEEIIA